MTRWRFGRFAIATALFATLVHVTGAVLVSASLQSLYQQRIYDVRRWPGDAASGLHLVGSFLRAKLRSDQPSSIVFAGSSLTFGHEWHERFTFPDLVAARHPGATVLNASVIGADVSAINDWVVCAMQRNHTRAATLIVELPVVNSLSYLVKLRQAGAAVPPLSACESEPSDRSYLALALTTFRGISWIRFLWHGHSPNQGERQFEPERVPDGYFASSRDFAMVKDDFEAQVTTTLRHALSVADVVYAFPSPVLVAALAEAGQDDVAVNAQLESARNACTSVQGVRCIDAAAITRDRRFFYNFTHLNQAGHQAMADLIDAQIARH